MKTSQLKMVLFVALTSLMTATAWGSPTQKSYQFTFKSIKSPIKASASSKEEAFKIAAKECFKKLTGGRYPGEDRGMEIIDICANPKM